MKLSIALSVVLAAGFRGGKRGDGQRRSVLPVRQLSGRMHREAWCCPSGAAGCARRSSHTWSGIPGHRNELGRPRQSRWKTLIRSCAERRCVAAQSFRSIPSVWRGGDESIAKRAFSHALISLTVKLICNGRRTSRRPLRCAVPDEPCGFKALPNSLEKIAFHPPAEGGGRILAFMKVTRSATASPKSLIEGILRKSCCIL